MSGGHDGHEEKTGIGEKLGLLIGAIIIILIVSWVVGSIAQPFNMAAPAPHVESHEADHDGPDAHEGEAGTDSDSGEAHAEGPITEGLPTKSNTDSPEAATEEAGGH